MEDLAEAFRTPGTDWLCMPLEVAVMFQRLSSPKPELMEALQWGARLHRLGRKAENTRNWYARNRPVARARDRRRVRNLAERKRARRRWYLSLKSDPERYQAWREQQRANRKRRHRD